MSKRILLVVALCAPAAVSAQISYPADTTVAYARAEGREAADADRRGDRAILAIAGGTLLGTFGYHIFGSENRDRMMLGALGGIMLIGSTQGSTELAERDAARIHDWPVAQQEAFRAAFAQRKTDRRMANAAMGVALGAVITLIVFLPAT